MNLNIVADANMPLAETLFSQFGRVKLMEGRNITRSHLLEADVLLVRSVTQVDKALLQGTQVKFVGSATIGVDHVDLDYLRDSSITFANAPGCNANSVVEYVFSALAQTSRLTKLLEGKLTLGIVGIGNVGSLLNKRCADIGIKTVCYDPFKQPKIRPQQRNIEDVSIEPLTKVNWVTFSEAVSADIVSLHVPLTKTGPFPTYHLINDETIRGWRTEKLLINASRGAVIDNKILSEQLFLSHLEAVLDVWEDEPNISTTLRNRCLLSTPHIAGYSQDGKEKGSQMLLKALAEFCQTQQINISPIKTEEKRKKYNTVGWDGVEGWLQGLNRVLVTAYPIDRDSNQLMKIEDEDISKSFDLLRKNYYQRQEFSNWKVMGVDSKEAKYILTKLGFIVE